MISLSTISHCESNISSGCPGVRTKKCLPALTTSDLFQVVSPVSSLIAWSVICCI